MSNMINPPIDDLKAKMDNNPYRLCKVVSNEAKKLETEIPAEIEKSDKKAISMACDKVADGKIVASDMVGAGVKPTNN